MEWELVNAKEVLRCHVFSVRRHRSRSPQTGQVHDFDILDSPDWVNVVPVTADQQLVLIEQFRHGIGAVTLEVPGGTVDADDPSPMHAGAREMREETGYDAPELLPLGVVHPNPAIHNNRLHIFLARDARRVAEPQFDSTEYTAVRLVPVSKLEGLVESGAVTHSLAVTALLLARLRLQSGSGA